MMLSRIAMVSLVALAFGLDLCCADPADEGSQPPAARTFRQLLSKATLNVLEISNSGAALQSHLAGVAEEELTNAAPGQVEAPAEPASIPPEPAPIPTEPEVVETPQAGAEATPDASKSGNVIRSTAQRISLPPVDSISLNTRTSAGILPENLAARLFDEEPIERQDYLTVRGPVASMVQWKAPWIAYRPLYFQDCALERHGADHGCFEPLVSAAKFYGRIPVLPYMLGAYPCDECVYSYGLARPGDCSPHFYALPRASFCGAVYQATLSTGLVFLTP